VARGVSKIFLDRKDFLNFFFLSQQQEVLFMPVSSSRKRRDVLLEAYREGVTELLTDL